MNIGRQVNNKVLISILSQIEKLQNSLNAMKNRIASEMDHADEEEGIRCWMCGGRMRKTPYRYHCRQDYGLCGYIQILHETDKATGHRKTDFEPTKCKHDGRPDPQGQYNHTALQLMVTSGKVVEWK